MVRFTILILLIVGISGRNAAYGQQCYQQIRDYSGFNTAPYQSELNTAACSLKQALPTEFQNNFKVFSCGFYVEHQFFNNFSYPEAFESVRAEAAAQSQYYLLLGRQSDPSGLYTRYWVDLKLPTTGIFHCMDEISPEFRQALTIKYGLIANQAHESFNRSVVDYAKAEKITMDSLKNFILQSFECCPPERNRSTGEFCVTCAYTNTDLKNVLLEEYPDINVSPCTYSMLFTPPFTSEYIVGGSNAEITRLGEVINLDLAAFDVVTQHHSQGHSAKAYIVHAGLHCLDFVQQIGAFVQDDSYAKFLFVLLPTGTGDGAELYCCSVIGGVVGNCPELNANGGLKEYEAKIVISDFSNLYYSGDFDETHKYIVGVANNDCINSKLQFIDKNNSALTNIEPAEEVQINPDSKMFGYLFTDPCGIIQPANFTAITWKLDGATLNVSDPAFSLFSACGENGSTLSVDITYHIKDVNGNIISTVNKSSKIKVRKANPEPILIALYPIPSSPNHTRAYYDINLSLNEEEEGKLGSALSLKYKFGPSPGVPSVPERLSNEVHIDKNDYGAPIPPQLFIGIRALFRSHKGDFVIKDNTEAFNIIEWNLKTGKYTGKDIPIYSPQLELNKISQGEVFKYTADLYAPDDVEKATRLNSLGVNISNGAPTDLYYFEIYVNGVPKMGPDGTTNRKFKAGSSPGDIERCELNYEKGQNVKIKVYKTGNTNAQKADWYINNTKVQSNAEQFGPYSIPDNNNFIVSAYKKNSTELWGHLYIQVKPKPAEEQTFDPTGIDALDYLFAVDENTRKKYDQLYEEVLNSIKSSRPNMMAPYTRASNPLPVQVNLTDNNYGGFLGNPNLMGYTNANVFRYTAMFAKLDHKNVSTQPQAIAGGDVITNAFVLVVKVDEKIATCFTAPAPDITIRNEAANNYINRLATSGDATDLAKSQELLNLYNAGGNAPSSAIDGYKQRVLENEWGLFMGFQGKVNIYIKTGNVSILDDYSTVKNNYLDTQPHEFAHGAYSYLYKYDNLRWLSLRDAVDAGKHPGKIYADEYKKNGPEGDKSHCSEGAGHEWYNPENTYSCGGGN